MARKEVFPPKMFEFRGRARVRFRGKAYYPGPWGSKEADQEYRKLIGRLAQEIKPEN